MAKKSGLPTIYPFGNTNEIENLALTYNEKKKPIFLTNAKQLEENAQIISFFALK